jgi:hypothetical protein
VKGINWFILFLIIKLRKMSKRNQKWQEEENLSDLLSDEDKQKATQIE